MNVIRSHTQDLLSADEQQLKLVHVWATVKAWHKTERGVSRMVDKCERCLCKRSTIKYRGHWFTDYDPSDPGESSSKAPNCFDPKNI